MADTIAEVFASAGTPKGESSDAASDAAAESKETPESEAKGESSTDDPKSEDPKADAAAAGAGESKEEGDKQDAKTDSSESKDKEEVDDKSPSRVQRRLKKVLDERNAARDEVAAMKDRFSKLEDVVKKKLSNPDPDPKPGRDGEATDWMDNLLGKQESKPSESEEEGDPRLKALEDRLNQYELGKHQETLQGEMAAALETYPQFNIPKVKAALLQTVAKNTNLTVHQAADQLAALLEEVGTDEAGKAEPDPKAEAGAPNAPRRPSAAAGGQGGASKNDNDKFSGVRSVAEIFRRANTR